MGLKISPRRWGKTTANDRHRCSCMKETALHKAARGGHCEIVQRLLDSSRFEAANALDRFDNTALHVGCLAGSLNDHPHSHNCKRDKKIGLRILSLSAYESKSERKSVGFCIFFVPVACCGLCFLNMFITKANAR